MSEIDSIDSGSNDDADDLSSLGKEGRSSTHGGSSSVVSSEHEEMERAIAHEEEKRVAKARIAVILVLLAFAGAAGFATYHFTQKGLEDGFNNQVG